MLHCIAVTHTEGFSRHFAFISSHYLEDIVRVYVCFMLHVDFFEVFTSYRIVCRNFKPLKLGFVTNVMSESHPFSESKFTFLETVTF
jgi:hypothetical protein